MTTLLKQEISSFTCPNCGQKIEQSWVVHYESPGLHKNIHMCSACGNIIKIVDDTNQPAPPAPNHQHPGAQPGGSDHLIPPPSRERRGNR